MYTPKSVIKKIKHLTLNFLWDNKKHKVKYNYLLNNYDRGGLKLMDVETQIMSLKLRWIGRLIDESEATWKLIPLMHFEKLGGIPLCLH